MTTPGDAVAVLHRAGGWATRHQLLASTTARELGAAVAAGRVVRLTRGVYALPSLRPEFAAAVRLGGVVSHASAAQIIGLALVRQPDRIHVTVPHGSARRERAAGVVVHQTRRWFDGDVELGTTSALRTVLDCATAMPFPEALAVADSALAQSWMDKEKLLAAAQERPGAGRQRRLRVAEAADRRAHNPFESVLRGILVEAGLTTFEPQGEIWLGRRVFPTSSIVRRASPSRRTASRSTAPRRTSSATASATTHSPQTDGRCCASPTARSWDGRTGWWRRCGRRARASWTPPGPAAARREDGGARRPERHWLSRSHGWSRRPRLSVPNRGARAATAMMTAITMKKVMADILRHNSSCH